MTQETRRKEIIHMLQSSVSLETNRLAAMFGVSPVTVRRDFEYFEKQGLVTTIYGGAMVNHTLPSLAGEDTINSRRVREKRMIAKAAADMVQPGDTVLLDAGSTIKELAIELLEKPNITVLTHSILAINVLAQGSNNVSLISMPGQFKKSSMCFFGAMTLDFLELTHVDYAFMGFTGVSHAHGCTIPDPEEAFIKRKMAKAANCTVVLADHWKLGVSSIFTALTPADVDILITGEGENEQVALLEKDGMRVIRAASDGVDNPLLLAE